MRIKNLVGSVLIAALILTCHKASGDMIEQPYSFVKTEVEKRADVYIPNDVCKGKIETILAQKEVERMETIPIDEYPVVWGDYRLTLEEFDLLCITTWCESGNQDLKAQRLVAKTILNRIKSELFPNNLHDVVYQTYCGKYQYSVVAKEGFPWAYKDDLTDQVINACFEAITTDDAPYDLFYFRNDDYHKGYTNYWNNGTLYFSRQ